MANLPSQHPNLALHLADSALTPLITSARAQSPHLEALTTLSHTALDAHESAQRLGLGIPQRIIVEHGSGPVFLQTFLSPHSSSSSSSFPNRTTPPSRNTGLSKSRPQHQGALALAVENRSGYATTETPHLRGGASHPDDEEDEDEHPMYPHDNDDNNDDEEEEDPNAPPMLVGIVVAPSSDSSREARRAAARLERVGREIQGRWFELHQGGNNPRPGQQQQQQSRTQAGD
ncbi:hypothetical protein F5B22DRAFT_651231 [Xylaria bambusicola]|uniref:uncharacterized protein n=1 Tax=Xylaria bambusicola TaxID=326684 RepID=UPI002008AE3C|nr:uncharacterized protein F5B22DRAFT_651231 [Xylaria bambusicola]KAI0505945.1 hypothetical protein F5B22DRAFT_651231 [Xylaria bambusicola]